MKKTILVTGGNRGIGKEICRQLSNLGHQVILGTRDLKKTQQLNESFGKNVISIKLDVTNKNDIEQAVSAVESKYGLLDVLINNAGMGIGNDGAIGANLEKVKEIMETNFFGAWQVSQKMIPLLSKSKDARIINMSSGMGELSSLKNGSYAGYRLSKTALNGLTLMFSGELYGKIKVNAMCPGWVKTDMGGAGASRSVEDGADTAVWLATENNIPTGKFFRDRKEISW